MIKIIEATSLDWVYFEAWEFTAGYYQRTNEG